ncbi:[Pyruvate dehydrogenase [acetyl-transferring]]-phosphatase 1, mitochondrial [Saitoella coloradoensis]
MAMNRLMSRQTAHTLSSNTKRALTNKTVHPPERRVFSKTRIFTTAAVIASCAAAYTTYSRPEATVSSFPSAGTPSSATQHFPFTTSAPQLRDKEHHMLEADEVKEKLNANANVYKVGRGKGVWRYDVAQIAANDPIEDDLALVVVDAPVGEGDWMFFGTFDGHSGWYTSDLLRKALVPYVSKELGDLYKKTPQPVSSEIDRAISTGFTKLDDDIVMNSVARVFKNPKWDARDAQAMLLPALSGACGMLSFYNTETRTLKVALAGDCRAVLGYRDATTGQWKTRALTVDQQGSNSDEEKRIRAEHPREPDVIRRGRILGNLEPSRAFGDAKYKWSSETQIKLYRGGLGKPPHPLLKTPPYVTARPEITTVELSEYEKDAFLIMVTDGLTWTLSNNDMVELVGTWLDRQKPKPSPATESSWVASFRNPFSRAKPVEAPKILNDPNDERGRPGIEKLPFTYVDDNAAVHLCRNALGGAKFEGRQVEQLLSMPAPLARQWRDDMTATVVFFGEGDGKVTGGTEREGAGTGHGEVIPKAKL